MGPGQFAGYMGSPVHAPQFQPPNQPPPGMGGYYGQYGQIMGQPPNTAPPGKTSERSSEHLLPLNMFLKDLLVLLKAHLWAQFLPNWAPHIRSSLLPSKVGPHSPLILQLWGSLLKVLLLLTECHLIQACNLQMDNKV